MGKTSQYNWDILLTFFYHFNLRWVGRRNKQKGGSAMPETLSGRERIINYLSDHDISRAQLATMYGMNKQDVSDYLAGRKTTPAANKFIITLIKDFGIKYERK